MTKRDFFIGLITLICTLLLSAAPAFAEFESTLKTTAGNGELVETALEAGGATVTCQAFTEGSGAVSWTIANAGKKENPAGTKLQVKVAKPGECSATSEALPKPIKAVLSPGCGFELKQAHQEKRLPLTITTACQFKLSTPSSECDLSMEPKGNSERNSIGITSNVILQPSLSNVSTTASGSGCKINSIESSTEGQLSGVWQMKGLQVPPLAELILSSTRLFFKTVGSEGLVTVTRKGSVQPPRKWVQVETPTASFEPKEEAFCKIHVDGLNEGCTFSTTFKKTGWQLFEVESINEGLDGIILRG